MKKISHRPSGYKIETAVMYYSDVRKYSPRFIIINPEGMATNVIAPTRDMCNAEAEAEDVALDFGKKALAKHLSQTEVLYFDQK